MGRRSARPRRVGLRTLRWRRRQDAFHRRRCLASATAPDAVRRSTSSRGRASTRAINDRDEDGSRSEAPDASSATSSSTTATIPPSSAKVGEKFLLGRMLVRRRPLDLLHHLLRGPLCVPGILAHPHSLAATMSQNPSVAHHPKPTHGC